MDLNQLWSDLGGEDAAKGHVAIWTLVAAPEKALGLLKERLKPAEPADPQRVRVLLTDIESPKFAVREAASRELAQMAYQAKPLTPLLREALEKRLSPEARRRIEGILSLPRVIRGPESLRRVRAIQVLEQVGTSEALQILNRLAAGAPTARETEDSKAALKRLAKQHSRSP